MIDEILHVSANLRADGGGAAHFGRLCGRAIRRFCAERGLRFRGLHLPASDFGPDLDGYTSCGGRKATAAGALIAHRLTGRRRALFFDHPGPARVLGALPGLSRSRHAIALLGVDAWRPIGGAGRRALRDARAVVAISEETLRRARPNLPPGREVVIVPPGIEAAGEGGAVDRDLLSRAGSGYVLTVGRMSSRERYKGHEELLAAVASLRGSAPAVRLVVAGDGDDRMRLERRASELGIAERCLFTTGVSRPTLAALYRRAALFAMPSTGEGFGLVFVEAMAAGLPCVALAGTAPAEIVVDGETGRLVPPGDGAALAAALAELLGRPETARAMGAAGRARYEREFTAEAFERRFEPVLETLVGA